MSEPISVGDVIEAAVRKACGADAIDSPIGLAGARLIALAVESALAEELYRSSTGENPVMIYAVATDKLAWAHLMATNADPRHN